MKTKKYKFKTKLRILFQKLMNRISLNNNIKIVNSKISKHQLTHLRTMNKIKKFKNNSNNNNSENWRK